MPESHTGSVVAPIFQTSTFMMDTPGDTRAGFDYARTGTPNRSDLEDALCELENASFAAAVNSGTSAEVAVFSALLGPGDEIIIPRDVYGGTFRLLKNEYERWGVRIRTVDLTDTSALAEAINERTAIVWVETPSNPGLDVVDIAATARLAHEANAVLAVDSTFATPILQRPIDLGADLVIHSTTKFINGHSDVIGGAVLAGDGTSCARAAEVIERLESHLASVGLGISPFDAWLTRRGIKTLRALALVANTKLITLAESLGGVESLIDHPATMTHLAVADSELSISGTFIRLSVGIEDIDDILADLDQALAATADTAGGADSSAAEDSRRQAPAAPRPTVASV
jgi:cystathionine gamma-synthase